MIRSVIVTLNVVLSITIIPDTNCYIQGDPNHGKWLKPTASKFLYRLVSLVVYIATLARTSEM